MSTNDDTTTQRGIARNERNTIENYTEVIHALARHNWMEPEGGYTRVKVDDPRLDDRDPSYLRVRVPRKGMTFKLIRDAREMGLVVDDVWQLDAEKAEDSISLKLEPREVKDR